MNQLEIRFPEPPTGILKQLDLPFPTVTLAKDDVRVYGPIWDGMEGEDVYIYSNRHFDLSYRLYSIMAEELKDHHQFIVDCFNEELAYRKELAR